MRITPYDLNEETSKIKEQIEKEIASQPPSNEFNEFNEVSEAAINEILEESNIVEKISDTNPNAKLKSYLDQFGGSLEKVASNIVDVMNRGETDSGRLKAAEFISKMHGVQVVLEDPNINNDAKQSIVVNINGTDSKTMINFFMPKS